MKKRDSKPSPADLICCRKEPHQSPVRSSELFRKPDDWTPPTDYSSRRSSFSRRRRRDFGARASRAPKNPTAPAWYPKSKRSSLSEQMPPLPRERRPASQFRIHPTTTVDPSSKGSRPHPELRRRQQSSLAQLAAVAKQQASFLKAGRHRRQQPGTLNRNHGWQHADC